MKPAVSMWSLAGAISEKKLSQIDFINWAAENNISNIELLSYYMSIDGNLPGTAAAVKAAGLNVSCYTINCDLSTLGEASGNTFLKDLDDAAALGSPFVRILAGEDEAGRADVHDVLLQNFSLAAAEAEKRDLVLVLENVGPLAGYSDEAAALIREAASERIRINFDTANPLLADEDPIVALKTLLPYTVYVHFKDFVTDKNPGSAEIVEKYPERIQISRSGVRMNGITAGEGEVPLERLISILGNAGYDGIVSVEYESDAEPFKATLDSLEYLKSLI